MTHFDSCDNLAFFLYSAQFDAVESSGKKTGVNSPGDTFYNSHSTCNVMTSLSYHFLFSPKDGARKKDNLKSNSNE